MPLTSDALALVCGVYLDLLILSANESLSKPSASSALSSFSSSSSSSNASTKCKSFFSNICNIFDFLIVRTSSSESLGRFLESEPSSEASLSETLARLDCTVPIILPSGCNVDNK